jgi:dTDP-4-dehydrorhamnose 3,5-epimerase
LLIPAGCAHGFLTLEAATDMLYQIDRAYTPGHARGLRYDDPALAIDWPAAPRVIAPADLAWPALES